MGERHSATQKSCEDKHNMFFNSIHTYCKTSAKHQTSQPTVRTCVKTQQCQQKTSANIMTPSLVKCAFSVATAVTPTEHNDIQSKHRNRAKHQKRCCTGARVQIRNSVATVSLLQWPVMGEVWDGVATFRLLQWPVLRLRP